MVTVLLRTGPRKGKEDAEFARHSSRTPLGADLPHGNVMGEGRTAVFPEEESVTRSTRPSASIQTPRSSSPTRRGRLTALDLLPSDRGRHSRTPPTTLRLPLPSLPLGGRRPERTVQSPTTAARGSRASVVRSCPRPGRHRLPSPPTLARPPRAGASAPRPRDSNCPAPGMNLASSPARMRQGPTTHVLQHTRSPPQCNEIHPVV